MSCLVAVFNSSIEKGDVSISRFSATCSLERVLMSGSLDFLPRRFLKWLDQFSRRFFADLLFRDHICGGVLAGKFFDRFPGKVMFPANMFHRESINFAFYEINLVF